MRDVVRWVDTAEIDEVATALEALGVSQAFEAARATWVRDERTRNLQATLLTIGQVASIGIREALHTNELKEFVRSLKDLALLPAFEWSLENRVP